MCRDGSVLLLQNWTRATRGQTVRDQHDQQPWFSPPPPLPSPLSWPGQLPCADETKKKKALRAVPLLVRSSGSQPLELWCIRAHRQRRGGVPIVMLISCEMASLMDSMTRSATRRKVGVGSDMSGAPQKPFCAMRAALLAFLVCASHAASWPQAYTSEQHGDGCVLRERAGCARLPLFSLSSSSLLCSTYYTLSQRGNCNNDPFLPAWMRDRKLVPVALHPDQYELGAACGACLSVTASGSETPQPPSFFAVVVDRCNTCRSGDIDLVVSGTPSGRWKATWRAVPCDVVGNVYYVFEQLQQHYIKAIAPLEALACSRNSRSLSSGASHELTRTLGVAFNQREDC